MVNGQDGIYVNNTSDTSKNPDFIFAECGEHIVNLTVTDSLGCDSTFTDTVIVYELPHPNFSTNAVCEGNPTCVNDLSDFDTTSNCFGHPISTWEWKIFDLNDSLVYSNLDSSSIDFCDTLKPNCDSNTISFDYNIMLTLTDTYGCIDSTAKTTTVYCQPISDFDSNGICFLTPDGATKYFENNSAPKKRNELDMGYG